VIIRAHGVPPETKARLESAGFNVVDATCPKVIKVQGIIEKNAQKGYSCIILGDRDHPEVAGLLGFTGRNGYVVNRMADLERMPAFEKAIIVAQTTQNIQFLENVRKWAALNHPHYKVFNTICDSTESRQLEARRLAEMSDVVVVVGGRDSGNTRRLVEIVQEAGKPACHVETAADLCVETLATARQIGITAGASTPNWIIRRVYRAIESLPFAHESTLKQTISTMQRYLLQTNIYVAMGAAALCFACMVLQEIREPIAYIVISFLYVLSMHILNNLTGLKEARFNDPDRADYYSNHKPPLTFMALASGSLGLAIAASMGIFSFVLLFVMSLLGLAYNLRILPGALTGGRYQRIRDIPGSKTILIALAWGMVTALFPVMAESGAIKMSTIPAFLWATGAVFVRTAFFDVLDMQGDRIVGKETLPLLIGRKKTLFLLRVILLMLFVILFLFAAFRMIPPLGFVLLLSPLYLGGATLLHQRAFMQPNMRLEFFTESHFMLVGVATLAWVFMYH